MAQYNTALLPYSHLMAAAGNGASDSALVPLTMDALGFGRSIQGIMNAIRLMRGLQPLGMPAVPQVPTQLHASATPFNMLGMYG